MSAERPVRAVLDPSAVLAYARATPGLGELLVEIAVDDAVVGVSTLALLDAYARIRSAPLAGAQARLGMLPVLPAVRLLPLGVHEAQAVSALVEAGGGDLARAHAAWTALTHDAYFVTAAPALVPSILSPEQVIGIGGSDPPAQ